ncbi:MAG: methionine biosynthesis protein MetW [Solirubrobacteraceae bacterium]|nr:methionine biosynthesis protein MetW [Solirubrobacteraceae bacterium]
MSAPEDLAVTTSATAPSGTPARRGGGRFEALVSLIGETNSVLDVGCRDGILRRYLPASAAYTGMDIYEPADIIASAEETLPVEDSSFETVVYADVLEHLDKPHFALMEGMRAATGSIVIALPNVFVIHQRLAFLRGRMATRKYDFGPVDPGDRHRWVMNVAQARAFAHGCAAQGGWHVTAEIAHDGGFRRPFRRVALEILSRTSGPDLWATTYMARLEPLPSA